MAKSDVFLKDEAQNAEALKEIRKMEMAAPLVILSEDRRRYWEGYMDALHFLRKRLTGGKY